MLNRFLIASFFAVAAQLESANAIGGSAAHDLYRHRLHHERRRRWLSRSLQELPANFQDFLDPTCQPRTPKYNASKEASRPTDIIQLTDNSTKDFVTYLELPSDTLFVESIAYNPKYSLDTGYVVVQRPLRDPEQGPILASYLYAVRPAAGELELVSETPLTTPDGRTTDISVWGSALTSDGRLIVSGYNRNSILVYDLKVPSSSVATAIKEILNVAAPNDVAIDPSDESIAYAAAGSFENITIPLETLYSNTVLGQVVKINLDAETTETIVDGLSVVAGIEIVENTIWISQLFDVLKYDMDTKSLSQVWDGANEASGRTWLADNLDHLYPNDDTGAMPNPGPILTPAWGVPTATFLVDQFAKNYCNANALQKALQAAGAELSGEALEEAFLDPETPSILSQTFVEEDDEPEPVRLIILDTMTGDGTHFEIDLVATRARNATYEVKDPFTGATLGRRRFFNEQVTHATHVPSASSSTGGHLVLVNFEVPRLMIVKDDVFLNMGEIDADTDNDTDDSSSLATSPKMSSLLVLFMLLAVLL